MTIEKWLGKNNKLGIDIWNNKYRFNNESFEEWLDRISDKNEDVRQLIQDKKFLFGGRILSNRGLNYLNKKVSLSNCYVIEPPEDNIESIFETSKKLARTFSYGGGCGIDVSKLRPKGALVNNASNSTTGATSFMDLYSLTTEIIGQAGRRAALMISIDVSHPDVEDFIKIKSDLNKVQKANISVKVDEEFMKAVEKNEIFKTRFIVKDTGEVIEKDIDANKLFKELCYQNWDFSEPGILFWDNIKNWNLLSEDEEFEYAGVNP